MRSPMRWMTISAALAGGVFIGPSPRPLAAADDLPLAGIGAAAEGGDRAGIPGLHPGLVELAFQAGIARGASRVWEHQALTIFEW